MDKNVKVSCVIPVYNREDLVGKAIESVLKQSFQDFEILLIDDGSMDQSCEVIERYQDPRIRILHNGENRGILYTRNRLLREAKGEYIAFLDSDDIAFPNRLQLQVEYLDQHPEVGIVSGGCYFRSKSKDKLYRLPMGDKLLRYHMIFNNVFVTSMTTIRRTVVVEHNIEINHQAKISEDYDLWIQLLDKSQGHILGEILGVQKVDTANSLLNETKAQQLDVLNEINANIRYNYLKSMGLSFEGSEWLGWKDFFQDFVGMKTLVKDESALYQAIIKSRDHFKDRLFVQVLDEYILRNLQVMKLPIREKIRLAKNLLSNYHLGKGLKIWIDGLVRKLYLKR